MPDECQVCGAAGRLPCDGCNALFYCSRRHRKEHSDAGGHDAAECQRMARQRRNIQEVMAFPFPWALNLQTSGDGLDLCAELQRQGCHGRGLWRAVCACSEAGAWGMRQPLAHCAAPAEMTVKRKAHPDVLIQQTSPRSRLAVNSHGNAHTATLTQSASSVRAAGDIGAAQGYKDASGWSSGQRCGLQDAPPCNRSDPLSERQSDDGQRGRQHPAPEAPTAPASVLQSLSVQHCPVRNATTPSCSRAAGGAAAFAGTDGSVALLASGDHHQQQQMHGQQQQQQLLDLDPVWHLPRHLTPQWIGVRPVSGRTAAGRPPPCSWESYCLERDLPMASPVALALHQPLTLYLGVRLADAACGGQLLNAGHRLDVLYLGPQRELDMLDVFSELSWLLPGVLLHLHMVGPHIPPHLDHTSITLQSNSPTSHAVGSCGGHELAATADRCSSNTLASQDAIAWDALCATSGVGVVADASAAGADIANISEQGQGVRPTPCHTAAPSQDIGAEGDRDTVQPLAGVKQTCDVTSCSADNAPLPACRLPTTSQSAAAGPIASAAQPPVVISFHRGALHEVASRPGLAALLDAHSQHHVVAFAANAGVPAYMSWLPTLQLLRGSRASGDRLHPPSDMAASGTGWAELEAGGQGLGRLRPQSCDVVGVDPDGGGGTPLLAPAAHMPGTRVEGSSTCVPCTHHESDEQDDEMRLMPEQQMPVLLPDPPAGDKQGTGASICPTGGTHESAPLGTRRRCAPPALAPEKRLRTGQATRRVPFIVTDYCEEALVRTAAVVVGALGVPAAAGRPVLNPFRQPVASNAGGNALPACSNGFLMMLWTA